MRKLKREDLILLREALLNVQMFIQSMENQRMPYYYLQFDNMIHNIGIYLLSDDADVCLINEILLRDWMNANHELLGLQACELICEIQNERIEEACRFFELMAIVEAYFLENEEEYEKDESV